MSIATTPAASTPDPAVAPLPLANCTAKPAHSRLSLDILRMMGLETSATLLGGQGPLAAALGIEPRSLRAKMAGDRSVSDADMTNAADALEARAAKLLDHASKMREAAEGDA